MAETIAANSSLRRSWTEHHTQIYHAHFVEKGREAARAALMIGKARALVAAQP